MPILLSCTVIIFAFANVLFRLVSEFNCLDIRKAGSLRVTVVAESGTLLCVEIGDTALLFRLLPAVHKCFVSGQWNLSVKRKREVRIWHMSLKADSAAFRNLSLCTEGRKHIKDSK